MEECLATNAQLKATLASLKAPKAETYVEPSEAQKKAVIAGKIIDMQEEEMKQKQKIDRAELKVKQLQEEIKEDKSKQKKIQEDIEKERASGKCVWETVGIQTVTYRDPFHTGLSKRTPTGALSAARYVSVRRHERRCFLRASVASSCACLTAVARGRVPGGFFTS